MRNSITLKRAIGFWALAAMMVAVISLSTPVRAEASCIRQFVAQLEDCAGLPTWYERTICGVIAYLEYVECLARIPFGG